MKFNLKLGYHLEHKNERDVVLAYSEGDEVICKVGDKTYSGMIAKIGYDFEADPSTPKPAIYLDTSESRTSHSGEVILVEDITYLYNDTAEYKREAVHELIDMVLKKYDDGDMTDEEQDKVAKILYRLWQIAKQEK